MEALKLAAKKKKKKEEEPPTLRERISVKGRSASKYLYKKQQSAFGKGKSPLGPLAVKFRR